MDYTTLLNLKKEPFSISPDPGFFYYSKDYQECLQKLELSIRLRRGLNIILGDVGTGKTTLSRALIQLFQGYEEFRFHLILDPSFNSEYEFLLTLIKIFNIPVPEEKTSLAFKEAIRTNLLREGLERKRVVVLIIDETQKMDYPFLELLRDFLNFETNEYKLLQLVLLGQMEFLEKTKGKNNFMDRINMIYFLKPLNLADTREMIEFRLRKSGYFSNEPLFTKDAYRKIYDYSKGFPRKIVNLCHHCLLMMLIKKQRIVDRQLVEEVVKSLFPNVIFPGQRKITLIRWGKVAGSLAVLAGIVILGFYGIFHERGTSIRDQAETPKEATQSRGNGENGDRFNKSANHQPTSSDSKSEYKRQDAASTSESDFKSDSKADNKNDLLPLSLPIKKIGSPIKETGERPPRWQESSAYQQDPSGEAIIRTKEGGYQVVADAHTAGTGKQDPRWQENLISRMALRLYGHEATNEILASIQKANPHISNLNLIEPGQKVYFPVLTNRELFQSRKGKEGSYIYGVRCGQFSTVAEAQDCLKNLSSIGSRAYIEREDTSDISRQDAGSTIEREDTSIHGETYSVVIGPFAKITDAWDIIDELKKKNGSPAGSESPAGSGTSISNNLRVMVINQDQD